MKMMSLRRTWICFLALSIFPLGILIAPPAAAQDYPNQTVKIIVPFTAGGGVDVAARIIAPKLGEELGRVGTATTGYADLKAIAVGRLFLDNIPHVKTHWPMVTPFLSQIALSFGCDDVEGTVVYERIYHEAGARTEMGMAYGDLVRLIRGAGKRPVERDSLYRAVRETFDDPPPYEPAVRRGASLPVVHAA